MEQSVSDVGCRLPLEREQDWYLCRGLVHSHCVAVSNVAATWPVHCDHVTRSIEGSTERSYDTLPCMSYGMEQCCHKAIVELAENLPHSWH